MTPQRAQALIVRFTDFSETSRIVTAYTRELGKVRGLAKGGRRLKSNFESALDLLTVCSIVLLRKPSRGLDLVIEARVTERFAVLARKLDALYAGYYLAELLSDFTQEDDPHPSLFDVAVATLRQLGTSDLTAEVVLHFETQVLRELGFAPILHECAACHRPLPVEGLRFDPQLGGIICPHCQERARYARVISPTAWLALQNLESSGPTVPLTVPVRSELRGLMNHTISHLLGRRPRTMQYLTG
ncbi:MAG: DNA repair protein RecO [Gemmatales bacterium]